MGMKKRTLHNIETLFRKRLSHESLSKEFEKIPDVWGEVQKTLPEKRRSRKLWLLLLLIPIGGYALKYKVSQSNIEHSISKLNLVQETSEQDSRGLLQSQMKATAKAIHEGPSEKLTKSNSDTPVSLASSSKSNRIADYPESTAGLETDRLISSRSSPSSSSSSSSSSFSSSSSSSSSSSFSSLATESAVIPGDFLHLTPDPVSTNSRGLMTMQRMQQRDMKFLKRPEEVLAKGQVVERDMKFWFIKPKFEFVNNAYLIRGSFDADPNTSFLSQSAFSSNYALMVGRSIDRNWIVETGIKFRTIASGSKYKFTIAYNSEEESAVGTRGVATIEHSIPSIGGGLDATTSFSRGLEDPIAEGQEIHLMAEVSERIRALEIPLTFGMRHSLSEQFFVRADFGVSASFVLGNLNSEVVKLESDLPSISYDELAILSSRADALQRVTMGYHFGLLAEYRVVGKPYSIEMGVIYQNTISPTFRFDDKTVFPRSIGLQLGVSYHMARS